MVRKPFARPVATPLRARAATCTEYSWYALAEAKETANLKRKLAQQPKMPEHKQKKAGAMLRELADAHVEKGEHSDVCGWGTLRKRKKWHKAWNVWCLENNIGTMSVEPERGGRALSFMEPRIKQSVEK